MGMPPIYFYLSPKNYPAVIPELDALPSVHNGGGEHSWILQTYLYLKQTGFPCQLVNEVPKEGIVIAVSNYLPLNLIPSRNQLVVAIVSDVARHPFAQLHIVQNLQHTASQNIPRTDRFFFPGKSVYIQHWSQPGLIQRDRNRGDRFENIAYVGRAHNLAAELRTEDWEAELRSMGLNWRTIADPEQWHDYSQIDAIVAIWSFDQQGHPSKPTSKLHNAWMAGVPAIVGQDSAFRQEWKSDLDYLKASSPAEVLTALKQLRDDSTFRQQMIDNGKLRSTEIDAPAVLKRWLEVLNNHVVPEYETWCQQSRLQRSVFLAGRSTGMKLKQASGTLK
ncbi:hypothetical protein ACQ4M3_16345 [Leptolyngbya sp. AN03gr2]|uniref:hypothetical protein n=1 Tax=unclassified Leptolyngbya TaxID=2650499 RepID=UPI003D32105D